MRRNNGLGIQGGGAAENSEVTRFWLGLSEIGDSSRSGLQRSEGGLKVLVIQDVAIFFFYKMNGSSKQHLFFFELTHEIFS